MLLLFFNGDLNFLAIDDFNISHNRVTDNFHILTVLNHNILAFSFNNKTGIFALDKNEAIVGLNLVPRVLNYFFSVIFLTNH